MTEENELNPEDKVADTYQKVRVMNPILSVEEIDKSVRKVTVENTRLPVEIVSGSVNINGTPLLEVKAAHQKWEYATAMYNDSLYATLNNKGAEGFELVCMTPQGWLIFKKPI